MDDVAFATLPEEDQEAVVRWLHSLGLDPDELDACPPLRLLVDVLAQAAVVHTLSPPMSRNAAWEQAADMLGAPSKITTWYRWQRAACANFAEPEGADGTFGERD